MKLADYLSVFYLGTARAGYFQQYKHLTHEERVLRREKCDAKVAVTQAMFPVADGGWDCPGMGLLRSRIKCRPTCPEGYQPGWTTKPRKADVRFMARCGDPATIAKK